MDCYVCPHVFPGTTCPRCGCMAWGISPIDEHELPDDIRHELETQDHVRLEYEYEMMMDYRAMREAI